MITPQQINEISFDRATFGGYDMKSVDAFLGPLTEDYVTLYKENSLLKSKMRVLVTKLEEYRNSEAAMKEAIAEAQRSCDTMVEETEAKCTQMLTDANAKAEEQLKQAALRIEAENERVEEARRIAAEKIDRLTDELNACLQLLAHIKSANAPAPIGESFYDYDKEPDKDVTAAVADEIAQSLENLVGTTDDEPQQSVPETTSRFSNLAEHFGPDYDPTAK